MFKIIKFALLLLLGVVCSACVNTFAVHELNERAVQFMKAGEIDSAIARLESSVDLDNNVYESRYNLAVAYIEKNECEKAIIQADKAEALIKNEPVIFYTQGAAYTCAAENIYGKKDKHGNIEEIEYKDPIIAKKQELKYIDYLKKANEAFKTYTQMVPTAEDINNVYNQIKINEDKLEEFSDKK